MVYFVIVAVEAVRNRRPITILSYTLYRQNNNITKTETVTIIMIKYHPAVFCGTRFSIYIGNNTGNVTYKLHDGIVSGRMTVHTTTMVVVWV